MVAIALVAFWWECCCLLFGAEGTEFLVECGAGKMRYCCLGLEGCNLSLKLFHVF